MEKTLVKTLEALAEYLDLSLGDLLEGITLHALEGKSPFSKRTLSDIKKMRTIYGLDLTARDSHRLVEEDHDDVTRPTCWQISRRAGSIRAQFPHRDHVRVSYELLERQPYPEALLHLARGLRRLAAGETLHGWRSITKPSRRRSFSAPSPSGG